MTGFSSICDIKSGNNLEERVNDRQLHMRVLKARTIMCEKAWYNALNFVEV